MESRGQGPAALYPAPPGSRRLVDTFGRVHDNLRVSVTDRCNIRCVYCMPEESPEFLARSQILSFEEITRFVEVATRLGVRKVRLTGGEPLIRRGLPVLIEKLLSLPRLEDFSLTTNGVLLAGLARDLHEAGLRRLNVHLDTLDRERFFRLTRRDDLPRVIEGIDAARREGCQVKINAVAVRGTTEEDIVPLARYARENDVTVRFIEYMPLDASRSWERDKVLRAEEILRRIAEQVGELAEIEPDYPGAPSVDHTFPDGRGRIGIIASVSRPFCASCNRIRLTADGKVRNCLFSHDELDVRGLLRSGGTDEELADLICRSVHAKSEGHEINTARFLQPKRPMYAIGG